MKRRSAEPSVRPIFGHSWNARADRAADCAMEMKPVAFHSPAAEYYELHLTAEDGAVLYARYICPMGREESANGADVP